MTDSRLAAYAHVRAAVLASKEPVRALCARHGVSWQAFYKHARARGWTLRQSGRRRPAPKGAAGKLAAIVAAYLEAIDGKGQSAPQSHLQAARLMTLCAATLGRLQAIKRKEGQVRRPRSGPMTGARREALAQRIMAICREAETAKPRPAAEERNPPGAGDPPVE